jgi:hypothetical protein
MSQKAIPPESDLRQCRKWHFCENPAYDNVVNGILEENPAYDNVVKGIFGENPTYDNVVNPISAGLPFTTMS